MSPNIVSINDNQYVCLEKLCNPLTPKSGNQIPTTKKVGNPFIYWDFRLILLWVPGGTRTYLVVFNNSIYVHYLLKIS